MQSHDTKNYNSTVGIIVGMNMTMYKNSLLNHENVYTFDSCRGHHLPLLKIPPRVTDILPLTSFFFLHQRKRLRPQVLLNLLNLLL